MAVTEQARKTCCMLGRHETQWHDYFLETFTLESFSPKDIARLMAYFGELEPEDFTDLLFAHKEAFPDPVAAKNIYDWVSHWIRLDYEGRQLRRVAS